jgi:hypothetical protein
MSPDPVGNVLNMIGDLFNSHFFTFWRRERRVETRINDCPSLPAIQLT